MQYAQDLLECFTIPPEDREDRVTKVTAFTPDGILDQ